MIEPLRFAFEVACPLEDASDLWTRRAKPLGSWTTCRHLSRGYDVENRGRFFPDARQVPVTSASSG